MLFSALKVGRYEQESLYGVRFPGEDVVRYMSGHDVGLLTCRDNVHVAVTDHLGEGMRFYLAPVEIMPGLQVVSGPHEDPDWGCFWDRLWANLTK